MSYNKTIMPKGQEIKQTSEENIAILAETARAEIVSGKVNYVCFKHGKQAEQEKIMRWIIAHSPKWRSDGSAKIEKEMRRLRLWEDSAD